MPGVRCTEFSGEIGSKNTVLPAWFCAGSMVVITPKLRPDLSPFFTNFYPIVSQLDCMHSCAVACKQNLASRPVGASRPAGLDGCEALGESGHPLPMNLRHRTPAVEMQAGSGIIWELNFGGRVRVNENVYVAVSRGVCSCAVVL